MIFKFVSVILRLDGSSKPTSPARRTRTPIGADSIGPRGPPLRPTATTARGSTARVAFIATAFAIFALLESAAAEPATGPASGPAPATAAAPTARPGAGASATESADPTTTPTGSPTTVRAETIAVEDERIRPAEIYQDTPVETEVLDEEKLRELPAINAIEALQAIPGIRITSQVQGQRGAVRIDGLPPEFSELLVNGQRYAGENERAQDLGDLLFANVERIEILRGPQALRYSARAAGGVIDIITKDPPTDGGTAEAMIANGDQQNVSGELTAGWGDAKLGGNLVYDYNQIGGFETPHPDSQDPDDGIPTPFGEGSLYRTHDVYGTVVARPWETLETRTRLGYRIRDEGFAIDDGPITSRRESQRYLLSQEGDLGVGAASSLHATLTFYDDLTDSSVGRTFRLDDSFTRLELRAEHSLELGPTTHVFSVGTDLSTFALELEEGPVPPDVEVEAGEFDRRIYRGGVYAIVESELASWLSSEIGIRREMHSLFFPAWLPQAALLFTPFRWDEERAVKLRLSAGRAVRYPSLRELYQPPSFQLGYFLAGSRDLEPEKVWAARASLEANPTRWISAAVSGFYSETSNYIRAAYRGQDIQIDEEVIPANPVLCSLGLTEFCSDQITPVYGSVFQNTNLDDLVSYGIEARLDLRPHETIELQLGYTWNRSRVADSNVDIDRLPNSPEHVANGVVTLTAPRIQTALTARGQWRGPALIEPSGTGLLSFASGEESNSSFTLDLRLRQPLERWLDHPIELFTDVHNVTDNRVIDSYVVRGRSFVIGLRGRFP